MTGATAGTSQVSKRLPRGRHGLTREEVVHAQRDRMLRALADAVEEKGYVGTSVADVLRGAGVSRETFYQQFSSKEGCFMEAYEAAVGNVLSRLSDSASTGADPLARFDRVLGVYLETLAADPPFARVMLIEIYAAGPAVLRRRFEAQQQFVDLVCQVFDEPTPENRFAAEALVAAISALVTARLAAEDVEGLLALREPLTKLARRISGRRE